MTKKQFYNLQLGTLVQCVEDWDMPFGWDDSMCDMVGIDLIVINRTKDANHGLGITLEHPETGQQFIFNHHCVVIKDDIMKLKYSGTMGSFKLNGFKYVQKTTIDPPALGFMALKQDLIKFKTLLNPKEAFVLNKENYLKVQKECPRLIGVMLSNNMLTKNREI